MPSSQLAKSRNRRALRRTMRRHSSFRPQLESLESRMLLAGDMFVSADDGGGNGADNGAPDQYTIVLNGGTLEVYHGGEAAPSQTFAFDPAAQLVVNGSGDDDYLTIDMSGGNPIPGGGLTFNGGGQITGDNLLVSNPASPFATATYGFNNANDGNIDLDGARINYTGIEPAGAFQPAITALLIANETTLNYGDGSDVITVADTGAGATYVASTEGAPLIFANLINSLTINPGNAWPNVVNVSNLENDFPADIAVNGGDAGDNVNIVGNLSLAPNRSLSVAAQDIYVTADSPTAPTTIGNIVTSGSGSVELTATRQVGVIGGSIETADGGIRLVANEDGSATGKHPLTPESVGVGFAQGALTSTGLGDIVLTGHGSDELGGNVGVAVTAGTRIRSEGSGAIRLTGTGGAGFVSNHGVFVEGQGTLIESATGDITLIGDGSGVSDFNLGVLIRGGALIESTGTDEDAADIEIRGVGSMEAGEDARDNVGVQLCVCEGLTGQVVSTAGDITIDGTGGAGTLGNHGFNYFGRLETADGDISVTGVGGSGDFEEGEEFSVGVRIGASIEATDFGDIFIMGESNEAGGAPDILSYNPDATIGGADAFGSITLVADAMDLSLGTVQSLGELEVSTRTAGAGIGLGDNAEGELHLDDEELASFLEGFASLTFSAAGAIDVADALVLGSLNLQGEDLTIDQSLTVDGDLTLDISGSVTFDVDAEGVHDQINVLGDFRFVEISGELNVNVDEFFGPRPNEVLTLLDVSDTSFVFGGFDGQNEGASIAADPNTFFLSYVGGDDFTDVTLTASQAVLSNGGLLVEGSDGSDYILVRPTRNARVEVYIRSGREARRFFFDRDRIIDVGIDAGAGNDRVSASRMEGFVRIDGGEGNDRIFGGIDGAVLQGGPGRDYLYGGPGADLMVGGAGRDVLFGKGGDDVLAGGSTSGSQNDLVLAHLDWLFAFDYDSGADLLEFALSDILDDDGERDLLLGQSGRDVYFSGMADRFIGRRRNERIVEGLFI